MTVILTKKYVIMCRASEWLNTYWYILHLLSEALPERDLFISISLKLVRPFCPLCAVDDGLYLKLLLKLSLLN